VADGTVVGLGGDGTYNEIANGLRPGVLMGVLPAGASSVFARHLGFPNEPVHAAEQLSAAIAARSTRRIGLGAANGRLFTFAAGLGLDAEATAIVDRIRHERPGNERPGDLRVLATAIGVLRAEGFAMHERMTLAPAGGPPQRCSYLAVANQHPYTFLGPIPVRAAPQADFEHGLDVVFTRELRSRDLWRLPVYALIWPRHARHGSRRIGYLHDLHAFTVDCDESTAFQIDGEYVGHVERVEFAYRPDAIEVFVSPT
jgi:diacylglycerol kinase family enzyme